MSGRRVDVHEIAQALMRPGSRPVITAHHNPDADAIGSMLGLARALRAAGQEVTLAHPDDPPVPADLAFLLAEGETIVTRPPEDLPERTLVTLDCASERRLWPEPVHERAALVVNIDHHQDNTLFGDLNLLVPDASSTAEVLMGVIDALGVPLDASIATPLYAGMVTDTGRFGYRNTSPATHRAAARLLEAGVDHAELARLLYENQPPDRLRLLGRALDRSRHLADGLLVVSHLTGDDFADAAGDDSEGIVEVMRSGRGVRVAALVREAGPTGSYRVSLRTVDPQMDMSALAREEGGGGHRAAAGFSTTRSPEDLFAWLERRVRERLGDPASR
ncbi:MAG TPA: bifunctional oligoribonuclease/PAP phosphatase NrnA [Miltoncostaeaceae bacterium]|nr:bifunctional oligoribonuclease/PAP phosphatase NrnA [Miltoncostaeaceae bacterium]